LVAGEESALAGSADKGALSVEALTMLFQGVGGWVGGEEDIFADDDDDDADAVGCVSAACSGA